KLDDLHGGAHFPLPHRTVARQCPDRDRFVDTIENVDSIPVDDQHPGIFSKQIAATRKCDISAQALALDRGGDFGGSLIFRHVCGVETRHGDFLYACGLKRDDFVRAYSCSLLEHKFALANRMHGRRATGIGDRDRPKLHAASAFFRRTCVISPMMATAISAGDTASISSPIGAWMRET